ANSHRDRGDGHGPRQSAHRSLPYFWPNRPPPSMRGERRPSRNSVTLLIKRDALVDDRVHLQERDFVLHQQLAAPPLPDLKSVALGKRAVCGIIPLQPAVPPIKLRKERFYEHVG